MDDGTFSGEHIILEGIAALNKRRRAEHRFWITRHLLRMLRRLSDNLVSGHAGAKGASVECVLEARIPRKELQRVTKI